MKNSHLKQLISGNSRGGVLVLMAILLFVLVGVAALAIDIGYLSTTRNELQNVADSAALAGAGYLGNEYSQLAPEDQPTKSFTKEEVLQAINDFVDQNKAAKKNISIEEDDIIIGLWDWDSRHIDNDTYPVTGPDAVKVKARRVDSETSRFTPFFAQIFGIDGFNVNVEAAAALSGPAVVAEGELKTPFGLSENVFPNDCTDLIAFSPTTDSCAGWHNFFDDMTANLAEEKLVGLIKGDTECEHCDGLLNGPAWLNANWPGLDSSLESEVTPEASAGDTFDFQGGTVSKLFNGSYLDSDYNGNTGTVLGSPTNKPAAMIALFDYFRYRDGDGDNSVWTATIPVYEDSVDQETGCMNPTGDLPIVGFAKIVVISPDPPPYSNIQVHIDCEMSIIEARGGGGSFGNIKGNIPNLVK